jgi:hypothetical protein
MNHSGRVLLGTLALALHLGLAAAEPPRELPKLPLPELPRPAAPSPAPPPAALPAPACHAEDDCGGGCCGLFGGAGLYLIRPYFENNPAYNFLLEGVTPEFRQTDRVDVRQHLDVSPLLWLGYMRDDGLGVRGRFWYFRQTTDQTVALPPFAGRFRIDPNGNVVQLSGVLQTVTSAAPLGLQAFGDTLSRQHGPEATRFSVFTELEVQVLDLEAMLDFEAAGWSLLLSGGVRLARIEQAYNFIDEQSTSANETRFLLSGHRFQGAGPVLAAEARLPLLGGLSVYGNTRGSYLFGTAKQQAAFFGRELRNDDPNPQLAFDRQRRGLAIAELELGLEYALAVGRSVMFGQIGVVGQEWFGAGNSSRSTNFTFGNAQPATGGAVTESDLGFVGLALRLGVDY